MTRFVLISFLYIFDVYSQISFAPKQMIILQSSDNKLWGNYIFGAKSQKEIGEIATIDLFLPSNIDDFRVTQGLLPEYLVLEKDQPIKIKKHFPNFLDLYGVDFLMVSNSNKTEMFFKSPFNLAEFDFLIPKSSKLKLIANNISEFKNEPEMVIGDNVFSVYSIKDISAGQSFSVIVYGIEVGRQSLWIVGASFFVLLIILSSFFTFLTYRKN